MSQPRELCIFPGCRKDSAPDHKHCWSHLKQQTRTGEMRPLREYGRPPGDTLRAGALRYSAAADAGTAAERKAAFDALRMAAHRYVKAEMSRKRHRGKARDRRFSAESDNVHRSPESVDRGHLRDLSEQRTSSGEAQAAEGEAFSEGQER